MSRASLILMAFSLLPLTARPQGDESFTLPPLETPGDQELSQALAVHVERIEVRGTTAIDSTELDAVTAPYVGRDVSATELQELRLALSNLYLENGFVNSGVILPDQSVSAGVIYYQAIEGEISRIEIEGSPRIRDAYVEKRLSRHISDPVSVDDVRYALQYIQNDPNVVRLDARLAPGDQIGEAILRVAVDEPPRFEFGVGASNHRATSTGEAEESLDFHSRNWAGIGEVIDISASLSEGAEDTAVSFSFPITGRNTSLQAYAGSTDSSIVEARLRDLDIESLTETWGILLTHPFVDRLDKTFAFSVGYETRRNESTLGGIPFSLSQGAKDGVSETNVALLGFDWTGRDDNHVLAARLTVRHGDDYQGATIYEPNAYQHPTTGSPIEGELFPEELDELNVPFNPTLADGIFDVVQTQLLYLRRIGRNQRAQFVVRTSGQIANSALMSIEKIAIGGIDTVRGFPENFLVRDNGVAGSVEFRLPMPGATGESGEAKLTLVPFVDYGRAWDEKNRNTIEGYRNSAIANSIASAGIGLVWQPIRGLRTELYWGADVHNDLGPGEDPRDSGDSSLQDSGIHFALRYTKFW